MTDIAYIIESADVRIPNACPELPDIEFEPVTAVNTAVCERCGDVYEIHSGRPTSYCKACRYLVQLEKGRKKYRKPEVLTCERIKSVCRQAQNEGTSYGKIMSKGVRK